MDRRPSLEVSQGSLSRARCVQHTATLGSNAIAGYVLLISSPDETVEKCWHEVFPCLWMLTVGPSAMK